MLTTITPYWGRPEALRPWITSIKAATLPEFRHIIYFIGETPPSWWNEETNNSNIITFLRKETPEHSIGYYHNMGASVCSSEWIMKLDIDTVPHVRYFRELLPLLRSAPLRHWFNGGMIYINEAMTKFHLGEDKLPIDEKKFDFLLDNRRAFSANSNILPAGTNFICRRSEYLALGGCDKRFRGWGWEDYQQIFMLEKFQQGGNPLPGLIDLDNVTRRCRDEISRRKAVDLWMGNRWLCLVHRWHDTSKNSLEYKKYRFENQKVLLDCVQRL